MSDPQALKQEILRLTREYFRQVHPSFQICRSEWLAGIPSSIET